MRASQADDDTNPDEIGCVVLEAPPGSLAKFLTPEMEAKQVASRERIRARNQRLFGIDHTNQSDGEL